MPHAGNINIKSGAWREAEATRAPSSAGLGAERGFERKRQLLPEGSLRYLKPRNVNTGM